MKSGDSIHGCMAQMASFLLIVFITTYWTNFYRNVFNFVEIVHFKKSCIKYFYIYKLYWHNYFCFDDSVTYFFKVILNTIFKIQKEWECLSKCLYFNVLTIILFPIENVIIFIYTPTFSIIWRLESWEVHFIQLSLSFIPLTFLSTCYLISSLYYFHTKLIWHQ